MAKKELKEQEQKFVDAIFKHGGNLQDAAVEAGYERLYAYQLSRRLSEHIIDAAMDILVSKAPKAALSLVQGVDGDIVSPMSIECAKQVLDRVGLVKKDKIEITNDGGGVIFYLPEKNG